MSNNLTIRDRRSFVDVFLNSISKISEDCILKLHNEQITSLCSTSDGTLVQYASFKNSCDFTQTLNIPDIKRLHKILGCLSHDNVSLSVDSNNITYDSSDTKFKFYLLDDGILSTPPISIEKIRSLEYDINFTIKYEKILELIRGSTLASESEKLYIYSCNDTGNIYGELTDKEKPNMDSFSIKLSEDFDKHLPPLAFNFENFRIISSTRCDEVTFKINSELGVVRVDITNNTCNITYIISALVK